VPEVRALVESLGVLPAWRHRGIARQLMGAAEQWARQHGAQRLMLNVWEFNVGALSLYADLGYTTFSRNLWKALWPGGGERGAARRTEARDWPQPLSRRSGFGMREA